MTDDFEGVFPILATPFDEGGNIDLESLERTVRFMEDIEVDGLTVLGVAGEVNRMVDGERERVIRTVIEVAAGRIPIIVGTSYSGTAPTRALSQMAESLGADGVMVAPSREPVPNEGRIFEFFQQVAEGISISIVVQDHPASTQVHMSVPLMLKLIKEIPQVACIKEEDVPTAPKISALLAGMSERKIPILTGPGALYGYFDLSRGSKGFMTGFGFPEVMQAIAYAARQERFDKVREVYHRFLPLIVYEQQPGVAIRKEVLRLRGLIAHNKVRHPGASIDEATSLQLRGLLNDVLGDVDITKPVEVGGETYNAMPPRYSA